jgi:hypothetical protein
MGSGRSPDISDARRPAVRAAGPEIPTAQLTFLLDRPRRSERGERVLWLVGTGTPMRDHQCAQRHPLYFVQGNFCLPE